MVTNLHLGQSLNSGDIAPMTAAGKGNKFKGIYGVQSSHIRDNSACT